MIGEWQLLRASALCLVPTGAATSYLNQRKQLRVAVALPVQATHFLASLRSAVALALDIDWNAFHDNVTQKRNRAVWSMRRKHHGDHSYSSSHADYHVHSMHKTDAAAACVPKKQLHIVWHTLGHAHLRCCKAKRPSSFYSRRINTSDILAT